MKRAGIRVVGIVQGVGFRPFIYRLANAYGLSGWVINDEQGVWVEVEGPAESIVDFTEDITRKAPEISQVESVQSKELEVQGETGFSILPSVGAAVKSVYISPDLAICEDCRQELQNPKDRRHNYAFINCTNCGPRYSIIQDVPYDRPMTTMASFAMCPSCQKEYENPADRRFHAQPNACEDCGPSYRLLDETGCEIAAKIDWNKIRSLVKSGKILALKGIGGYHLVCDAKNEAAVEKLRQRKFREDKPFAVMCGSLTAARALCQISAAEEKLLTSSTGPIVLLEKKEACDIAAAVAPGNPNLGVMLPYAPVHCLLLKAQDTWVLTSGNISEEPISYKDEEAVLKLAGLADYFLVHNREIHCRVDDSVLRVFKEEPYILRRSRGMAPAPIRLGSSGPSVLACGGESKNTFCLTKESVAFVSAHIGDLSNLPTLASYKEAIGHYQRLFDIKPDIVAYDLHPEYLSSKYASGLDLPRIGVQHHHAHIASVLAEHGICEKVIGVPFDGTGYGDDGLLWGGEFLVADCKEYERVAHCRYLPLPGGEKAAKEPWRQALWLLQDLYGADFGQKQMKLMASLPKGWELLLQAAAKGINTPLSSSAGRLFDSAAALLGIRFYNNYEGQAAVELELRGKAAKGRVLPFDVCSGELDFRPTFMAMIDQLDCVPVSQLAADFHVTVAAAIEAVVRDVSKMTGIKKVALSGGVFQNMTLLELVNQRLSDFTVLLNRRVPPNDGGLSLGQAAVARERGRSYVFGSASKNY